MDKDMTVEEALEKAKEAAKELATPPTTEEVVKYIMSHKNEPKYRKAAELLEKPITLHNKGAELARAGKYKEAIGFFDKAIRCEPGYALAWYNKGISLFKLGKRSEAGECFKKAHSIDSKFDTHPFSIKIFGIPIN